jgi:hypothetical protein
MSTQSLTNQKHFILYARKHIVSKVSIPLVLWRPKNFGRHFLDIQVKCKYTCRNRNPTFDSCHFDNQFKLFEAQIFQKSDICVVET